MTTPADASIWLALVGLPALAGERWTLRLRTEAEPSSAQLNALRLYTDAGIRIANVTADRLYDFAGLNEVEFPGTAAAWHTLIVGQVTEEVASVADMLAGLRDAAERAGMEWHPIEYVGEVVGRAASGAAATVKRAAVWLYLLLLLIALGLAYGYATKD